MTRYYYDKLLKYVYKTAHELDCVVIGSFSVLNYAHTVTPTNHTAVTSK